MCGRVEGCFLRKVHINVRSSNDGSLYPKGSVVAVILLRRQTPFHPSTEAIGQKKITFFIAVQRAVRVTRPPLEKTSNAKGGLNHLIKANQGTEIFQ